MTLSFSEYDKMIETFRSYNTPVFLPSLDEIAMFERDPERWLRFAIYLSEFGPAPKTDPSVKDKLVTLSTCALQGSRRFVVQGYLVETITLD